MTNENIKKIDKNDLTQGSIIKKLLLFSLPIIAGNLMQQLYNVVDTLVVGNFEGSDALAAVSVAFPVMLAFSALYMGLSMGANIIISQSKGANDTEGLTRAVSATMGLSVYVGLAVTVLGLLFGPTLLNILNTPANILEDANTYLSIIFLGTIASILYNGCTGIVRGLGDSSTSFIALAVASVTNIILDLVFVAYFHMGVAGVAIATTIAQIISAVFLVRKLLSGFYGIKFGIKDILRIHKPTLMSILKLGIPSSINDVAMSVGSLLIQSFANNFGSNYIAANSVVMKVDGFAMMPMISIGMAITTFVGQNIGAGNDERAKKGIKDASLIVIGIGLIMGIIFKFFGRYLVMAFTDTPIVLEMGSNGLSYLAFYYILLGLTNVISGSLRGAGSAVMPAVTNIVSSLVRIPLAYLLAVKPLRDMINAAVQAGSYATYELAKEAGVGIMENYMGLFHSMGISILAGFALIALYYRFGKWQEKGHRVAPMGAPGAPERPEMPEK